MYCLTKKVQRNSLREALHETLEIKLKIFQCPAVSVSTSRYQTSFGNVGVWGAVRSLSTKLKNSLYTTTTCPQSTVTHSLDNSDCIHHILSIKYQTVVTADETPVGNEGVLYYALGLSKV